MIPDPVVQPTDVGHTAQMYAQACPERIIVNPYMGWDSIQPFVEAGKDVVVLGCSPWTHPRHCRRLRRRIRRWPCADKLEIAGCQQVAKFVAAWRVQPPLDVV